MSIMETTQESLQKTVEGVKDSQTLEKAITLGSNQYWHELGRVFSRGPEQAARALRFSVA